MYRAVKRHKRLWIVKDDVPIYTPPDFIRLQSRESLIRLAEDLNNGIPYIDAVMNFERSVRGCKSLRH